MKKKQYTFTLELEVYDMAQLAQLAHQRALEEGLSEEDWTFAKKDSHDLPSLYLQMILSRSVVILSGSNIHQSDVERIEVDDDGFDEE
jgi:hypothetical protein